MFTIYQESPVFRAKLALAQPSDLVDNGLVKRYLNFSKFFLVNAAKACKALLDGRLTQLDPIVGENSCQIRALAAIQALANQTLLAEATLLKKQCENHLGMIQKHFLNPPDLSDLSTRSTDQVLADLKLSLAATPLMSLLLKAHLLTVGKFFKVLTNGKEISGVDVRLLRNQLSPGLRREVIREIVCIERVNLAKLSVNFLLEQAAALPASFLVEERMIRQIPVQLFTSVYLQKKGKIENQHVTVQLPCSCAFYNLKLIFALLGKQQVPILLKEYRTDGELSSGYFFRSVKSGEAPQQIAKEELEKNQPIFVIECHFSVIEQLPQAIEKEGLMEIALANVAMVKQFSGDDKIASLNAEEQKEIMRYKELGEKLGCQTSTPALFSIVHTHAATVQEEPLQ